MSEEVVDQDELSARAQDDVHWHDAVGDHVQTSRLALHE